MIKYDENRKIWVLEARNISYALGVSETGLINNIYFGEKLPYISDYPEARNSRDWASFTSGEGRSKEEYMAWSKIKYTEPCIKATFHDNVRDVVLKYDSFDIKDNTLTVILKDVYYPLEVRLHYTVIEDCDLIERYAEIINKGTQGIRLENVLSGSIYVPRETSYRLSYLTGKWAGETQLNQVMVPETKIVLESRRGTTSHHANPWFALDKNAEATEDNGDVYFGALAWSGNWKIVIERDNFNLIKVSAGVNDFDFAWHLKPGEKFVTPKFIVGFSNKGFGQASRNLHSYQLKYVLPENHRNSLRKVLYNSWEATGFDISEEGQIKLAEIAASLGVELFVMDDGWFGARNNDKAGLGDWYVNKEKFPNGLKPLIDKVNALGMDFGLWVEPEMVNPDSDLYRKHPDWVYHFPTRERTEARNQLILNLAREDVREYIYDFMDRLLSEYNIKFIKWDMNRNFSEPGYPSAPEEGQREIWVRHVQGVYEIVDRLRKKHPDVVFQSCSGGGGRVDLGILRYFDQVWTSDNTDAFDRLKIQEGFSYAYCAKIMEAWVTDGLNWLNGRKLSLRYRFHSSMMGNLGIGVDLMKLSEEEKQEAKELISLYKEIRPIIQHGQQYRLLSPRNSKVAAFMYVSEDKAEAILFTFLHSNSFGDELPAIRLKGLDENALYAVEGYDREISGKALMNIGINVDMRGDFDSRLIRIKKTGN